MALLLRNHPQIVFLGSSAWPPAWSNLRAHAAKQVEGEVGTLIGTILPENVPTTLYVQMEYDGEPYLGTLMVDDAAFARKLHDFLQKHIGLSIKEVGNLDLSHML